jgi:hypothetical protein
MLKKLSLLSIAILLLPIAFTMTSPNVKAVDPCKLYIDPPAIIDQTLVPTSTFNITVKVDNIPADPGLVGLEFNITWNPSLLNGVAVQEIMFHEVTPPALWDNIWQIKKVVANNSVNYAFTFQDISAAISGGYAPISGSHIVANITLRVVGMGESALHFYVSNLGDSIGGSIAHDTYDGFFRNLPPPPPKPPALLYVDPPMISNVGLTPGSDFSVDVDVINASDVAGLEFSLGFNATLLNANSVISGSFIPIAATINSEIDNATGLVKFNVSTSSPMNGDGILAQIDFHVLDLGNTLLHLYGIQLVDSLGQPLNFTSADGSFDNVLLAKLAVEPPEIIDPTLVPPATFKINVTIEDVRDLYGYQFNLTFDKNVLVCLQTEVLDVLNETYYIPNQMIDNTRGFVFINVTYYSPAIPLDIDGPTTLVTIKFRVKSLGATNLTLTDTGLVDPDGQPITHEVHDGFFQSLIVDVGIVDISAAPTALYPGGNVNVSVTATNTGNATETFSIDVYRNSTLLTTLNVTGLAPNTNYTVTFVWNTLGVSWGKYVLSAQILPLPFETHISDNTLIDGIVKLKIPGDINNDDVVDIFDATLASLAFASKPGSPNWNPDADLNGDGLVDIFDMIILSSHFGQKI